MRLFKRITSVALAATTFIAASSVCFNDVINVKAAETKLTFTVMCDSSVVTEANGAEEFYNQLEKKLNCNIKWIRPDHSSYNDTVMNTFANGDLPDVVLLSNEYLNLFANRGYLWDMTEAWNNSKTKNSGRLKDYAEKYIEANGMAYNTDNKLSMFGFSPQRGNGVCTYIKAGYLRAAGYDPEYIKSANLTFDQYYEILKKIKKKTLCDYVIKSPGFTDLTSPYTIFLPDFYQNAQFGFYMNSDGNYTDGFTEQAMQDALNRISTAVKDGIISSDSKNTYGAGARNAFSSAYGSKVLSYYSGVWGNDIRTAIDANGGDSDLIAIKPVSNGKYIERRTSSWAITNKNDGRQQLIFDKFIDTMLDGSDVQMLWTYGAKGTHWDIKKESFTVNKVTYSYKEGEFHMLPRTDSSDKLMTKNYIDPVLSLGKFNKDMLNGQVEDPIKDYTYSDEMKEEIEMFINNSEFEPLVPVTLSYYKYNYDINSMKRDLIDKVASNQITVDQAMAAYRSSVGIYVNMILDEFKDYAIEQKKLAVDAVKSENDKTVTFTAQAEGGKGNYTYKFIVYNKTTGTWGLIQNYSSKNTCTWTKGSAGDRDFYVDVKDSDGNVVRSKAMNVKIESTKPTAVLTPSSTAISAGGKLTLTASTNKSGCTYKFLIYNPSTNQWFKLQDFGSKNTYTWTAGSNGTRQFYVDVKDSNGNVTRSKVVNVTIGNSGALSVKTAVSANTTKVGDKITFTAEGTGGKVGYTYKMVVYNKTTKTWGLVQNFNANNKITWTAGSAGDREFYIDVKDADGKVVRSSVMNVKTTN